MGYISYVSGGVSIDPPIRWKELRPYLDKVTEYSSVKIVVEEIEKETEEGVLQIKSGVSVVAETEEGAKFCHVVRDLQSVVDAFPAHKFLGYLEREGQENGDMERYRVNPETRKVETLKPEIVWNEDNWSEGVFLCG